MLIRAIRGRKEVNLNFLIIYDQLWSFMFKERFKPRFLSDLGSPLDARFLFHIEGAEHFAILPYAL